MKCWPVIVCWRKFRGGALRVGKVRLSRVSHFETKHHFCTYVLLSSRVLSALEQFLTRLGFWD